MLVNLTKNEEHIIQGLRSLQPYETLSIIADETGKPDRFRVKRTTQVVLSPDSVPRFIPTRPDDMA